MNSDCSLKFDSISERDFSIGLFSSEGVRITGVLNMDQFIDFLDISINVLICFINIFSFSFVGVYQNSDSECDFI